jgi:uncharacterized membrane protein
VQRLLDQHPEFNDWQLAFLTPLPTWAVILLLAGLVLAVVAAHRGLKSEPRRGRRILLTGLRSVAVVAAAFLLLEPAIQLLQVHRVKNRVAVLLDTSGSMGLPAGVEGKTRLEVAQDLLEADAGWFSRNGDRFVFEYATFDSGTYPSDRRRLVTVDEATGRRTDLMAALRSVASGAGSGRRLAGVLLLTDGVDTEALAGGMTAEARRELEALGAPVHVFAAGGDADLKDLAITRVLADDFAFVRSAVEIEVVVQSRGYPAQTVPVILRREGRVVSTQSTRLEPGQESRVTFRFTPDTTGKFVYTVEVPVLEGEAVTSNNQRSFVLKVIRDRVRVLQVAGRPSWDQRFLRSLLKKDPNVDLISFFILRTPQNTQQVNNSELSLIPFPTHELFTQELGTFDLVVFQNFDYLPYGMAQYLGNVRRYVEEGGSFVMIGGEKSFSEGRYQGTYIEDILPVELLPARSGTLDGEVFQPRLTEHGRRHPITQVGPAGESLERVFERLPELPSMNRVRGVRRDAQVLLEHPFRRNGAGNAPVVVVGESGRGRTMAVMTDGTWFWSFPAAGGEGDRRVYDRFWSNALRWLVRDPDLTHVRVRPVRDAFEPGETPILEVDVRDRDYGPAEGARVLVEIERGDGGGRVGVYEGTTGEDGTATIELEDFEGLGPFKVIAEAKDIEADLSLGREEAAFVVSETSAQLIDPAPRPQLLRAIAEATGGAFHELPRSAIPGLAFVDPEVVEVGRKQNHDVWDWWGWMLVLIGAIGTEWALRRRWGQL